MCSREWIPQDKKMESLEIQYFFEGQLYQKQKKSVNFSTVLPVFVQFQDNNLGVSIQRDEKKTISASYQAHWWEWFFDLSFNNFKVIQKVSKSLIYEIILWLEQ